MVIASASAYPVIRDARFPPTSLLLVVTPFASGVSGPSSLGVGPRNAAANLLRQVMELFSMAAHFGSTEDSKCFVALRTVILLVLFMLLVFQRPSEDLFLIATQHGVGPMAVVCLLRSVIASRLSPLAPPGQLCRSTAFAFWEGERGQRDQMTGFQWLFVTCCRWVAFTSGSNGTKRKLSETPPAKPGKESALLQGRELSNGCSASLLQCCSAETDSSGTSSSPSHLLSSGLQEFCTEYTNSTPYAVIERRFRSRAVEPVAAEADVARSSAFSPVVRR